MPDTTSSAHPSEAYFPISAPAVDPARDAGPMAALRTSSVAAEAASLLREGQQVLLESRADEGEPLLRRALDLTGPPSRSLAISSARSGCSFNSSRTRVPSPLLIASISISAPLSAVRMIS